MLRSGVEIRGEIRIVRAKADHIDAIAHNMREADIKEVMALNGSSPRQALEDSLAHSAYHLTVLCHGRPEIMFGVGDVNILSAIGAPWLLGTEWIEKQPRVFLRHSRHWCDQLFRPYRVLINVVDDRNLTSKRWLQWLGFTLHAAQPLGKNGELFCPFEMKKTQEAVTAQSVTGKGKAQEAWRAESPTGKKNQEAVTAQSMTGKGKTQEAWRAESPTGKKNQEAESDVRHDKEGE